MVEYVRKNIFKYLENSNINKNDIKIQLGYSGGLDSSCLLDILIKLQKEFKISIFLSYVNYNTTSYSDLVLTHINSFLKDIKKNIKNVNIEPHENFESKARNIRYDFFNEISKKYNIDLTFTAHHGKDQLETLINITKNVKGVKEIVNYVIVKE